MNDGLRLSSEGGALVRSFEGCLTPTDTTKTKFRPYVCPAGVLTIGWGHTNDNGRKFKPGDIWTRGECDAEFRADMQRFEAAVRRRVKVELTQHQFDALVSFTYNCGEGNLAKSSLLRKVNVGDFKGAASAFALWNRGGGRVLNGLTRRRAAEAALFRDGNHRAIHEDYHAAKAADPDGDTPMPQGVDVADDSSKPMSQSKIGNGAASLGAGGAIEAASKVKDAVDQANSVKDGVKDLGVLDVLTHLVTMPTFWIAIATVVIAGFVWYWRREHALAGI